MSIVVTGEPKPCCLEPGNLENVPDERPDITVNVCRECGCRHIELSVDPVELGVKVESL